MFFRPIYLPLNEAASGLVLALAKELGISVSGKAGKKHTVLLSSFIFCAQHLGSDHLLQWPTGNESKSQRIYSLYPAAGLPTIHNVRRSLISAGYVEEYDWGNQSSGLVGLSNSDAQDLMGMSSGMKKPATTYKVDSERLQKDDRFYSASFVDALQPYVLVNEEETHSARLERKRQHIRSPKMAITETKKVFGAKYSASMRHVREMNAFWLQHPLMLPSQSHMPAKYYASAKRIYHNGSMESGGRWYGGWCNLRSEERLHLRIDDEPICEVDLNASQASLFSALMGIPMNVGETWEDAYASVVEQLRTQQDPSLLRDKVKQVVVEMIGSGNANRNRPASLTDSLFNKTAESIDQYKEIRIAVLEVFPALHMLNGDYLNFSGFLSFHEANVLTQSLLSLKRKGIVAYGVHDCIIAKQTAVHETIDTYRNVIEEYVLKHQKLNNLPTLRTSVALGVEQLNGIKKKYAGRYY